MTNLMISGAHAIPSALGIARQIAYWCAIYWAFCLVRAVGPTLWQSFGVTLGDVFADLHRRAMAEAPRLERRGVRIMILLARASYAGRIAIYARLATKMLRRGAVFGAVEGWVCVILYSLLGPFAAPLVDIVVAPPTMLAGLFNAYCGARYVAGRTWRGSVAYAMVATWPAACRRLVLWPAAITRLRSQRRIWRSARPTWAQARLDEEQAQREEYARRLAAMEAESAGQSTSFLASIDLSLLKAFPVDGDPRSLN